MGKHSKATRSAPAGRRGGESAAGIKPGIYYIVNNNVLLTRTYSATPAELEAIILGQLREIWSEYVRATFTFTVTVTVYPFGTHIKAVD